MCTKFLQSHIERSYTLFIQIGISITPGRSLHRLQSYLILQGECIFCKRDLDLVTIIIILDVTGITERKSGSFGKEVSATMQMLLVSSHKNMIPRRDELMYIHFPFGIQAHRPVSDLCSICLVIITMM